MATAFGNEPVKLIFVSGKVARRNLRSNLPTGLTLIHGRGMTWHKPKARGRAGDSASWRSCVHRSIEGRCAKFQNCFRLQVQAYNRASGGARPPLRSLLQGRCWITALARLSFRFCYFLMIDLLSVMPLFLPSKSLKYRR